MASAEPIAGRCGARVKPSERVPTGGYCQLPPMRGQARCGSHGGRAPKAKAAAERRLAEAELDKVVHRYGFPVEVDPLEAALAGLHETYGAVLALRAEVQRTEPEALDWSTAEEVTVGAAEFPGVNRKDARGSVLVDRYERERDRLHRISTDLVRLGVTLRAEQRDAEVGRYVLDRLRALARALGHEETPAVLQAIRDVLGGTAGRREIEA